MPPPCWRIIPTIGPERTRPHRCRCGRSVRSCRSILQRELDRDHADGLHRQAVPSRRLEAPALEHLRACGFIQLAMAAAARNRHRQRLAVKADQHFQHHRAGQALLQRTPRVGRCRCQPVFELHRCRAGRDRRDGIGRAGAGAGDRNEFAAGIGDDLGRCRLDRHLRDRALRNGPDVGGRRRGLLDDLDRLWLGQFALVPDDIRVAVGCLHDCRRRQRQRQHQQAERQQVDRDGPAHGQDPGGIQLRFFSRLEQGKAVRTCQGVGRCANHGRPPSGCDAGQHEPCNVQAAAMGLGIGRLHMSTLRPRGPGSQCTGDGRRAATDGRPSAPRACKDARARRASLQLSSFPPARG